MKKRILWMLLSFLLVASLVLASCAKEVIVEEEEEEEEEVIVEEEEEEEEVEEPAVGEPQYGGTLTISAAKEYDVDMKCWDPLWSSSGAMPMIVTSRYLETLFTGDASKGATGTGEHFFDARYIPREFVKANLAEGWEIKTDPLRLIISIRPGIYWNEVPGIMERRELTADDVAFSMQRFYSSPIGGVAYQPLKFEWIKTFNATDKYTFVLELNYLTPLWMAFLGLDEGSLIVPHEVVEAGSSDWSNWVGVGTGPFLLKGYVPDSFIEYEKNLNYRETTIIDDKEYPTPFVDELIHTFIPDEGSRIATLRTGTLDILFVASWAGRESLAHTTPELLEYELENWGYVEIAWRCDRPPFDNLLVRQALSMAVDRDFIVDSLYGGFGIKYNYPLPTAWGETLQIPMWKQPKEIREVYEYDPVEAKRRLTLADYPDGFETTCLVRSASPLDTDIVSLVADYWHEHLGVELEIEVLDPAAFSSRVNVREFTMAERQEDGPNPTNIMDLFVKDAGYDANIWDDAIFMDLLDRYSHSNDPDEQDELMRGMATRVTEEVISCFLPAPNTFRYAWPWVKNYFGEANSGYWSSTTLLSRIWIDQDLKEEMGY